MKRKTFIILLLFAMRFASAQAATNLWAYVNLDITPTNDLYYASRRLYDQSKILFLMEDESYPAKYSALATNLWDRLAVLHGDLREKKLLELPPVYRNFGIITNQVELQDLIVANSNANRICSYQSCLRDLEKRIEIVLANAAISEALASFPPAERNAIVSNLVETARLTADEVARLGLTNVVEQVGGE